MKIFVCVKDVPARDSQLRIPDGSSWIDDEDLEFEMNEPDAYALEEALRLKEKHGGEVVAISAGAARASRTVREALAKGADRGILIEDDRFAQLDCLTTARALAAAIKREEHDLILTGLQSDDAGFGQVGVVLAELLGLPHATIIMEVQVDGSQLHVKRELEAGWFQQAHMPLPALLSIQSGINKVRYATLMGIKKARKKPLERLTVDELKTDLTPAQVVQRIYAPSSNKETQFLEGNADEVADQLVTKLKTEARVL